MYELWLYLANTEVEKFTSFLVVLPSADLTSLKMEKTSDCCESCFL